MSEVVRGSISGFNHASLCVSVLVRIAVIVKKAMRSEPDVRLLGMTELGVIKAVATDLTGLCFCRPLVSHQLLSNTTR